MESNKIEKEFIHLKTYNFFHFKIQRPVAKDHEVRILQLLQQFQLG
jgi:hypothetical protein